MKNCVRHLEVMYCDDIRGELGNKFSYMGVYSGQLTVPNAPVMLPKLCISARVTTDIDDPFESLEVRIVSVKGEEETELVSSGPITLPSELPSVEVGSTLLMAQMNFVLSPFQIVEETVLRVKAITERDELRGSSALRIRIVPPAVTPTIQ